MKRGYVVRLNSGGPAMTVVNWLDGDGSKATDVAMCAWFDGGRLRSGQFFVGALCHDGELDPVGVAERLAHPERIAATGDWLTLRFHGDAAAWLRRIRAGLDWYNAGAFVREVRNAEEVTEP